MTTEKVGRTPVPTSCLGGGTRKDQLISYECSVTRPEDEVEARARGRRFGRPAVLRAQEIAAREVFAGLVGKLPKERRRTVRQRLRRIRRPAILGTLGRTRPLSDQWGRDRGTPIDRY